MLFDRQDSDLPTLTGSSICEPRWRHAHLSRTHDLRPTFSIGSDRPARGFTRDTVLPLERSCPWTRGSWAVTGRYEPITGRATRRSRGSIGTSRPLESGWPGTENPGSPSSGRTRTSARIGDTRTSVCIRSGELVGEPHLRAASDAQAAGSERPRAVSFDEAERFRFPILCENPTLSASGHVAHDSVPAFDVRSSGTERRRHPPRGPSKLRVRRFPAQRGKPGA